MRVGLLPLARPTFDVEYAQANFEQMLAALDQTGVETTGPRSLLFDVADALRAIEALKSDVIDYLLVMQVTFTDAGIVAHAAKAVDAPIGVWAIPEPRNGGRLRLNSFCGLNLAAHALGLNDRAFSWLYAAPDVTPVEPLKQLLSGERLAGTISAQAVTTQSEAARAIVDTISGKRVARIGAHPDGFDTCAYDPGRLHDLAGVQVDALELETLFDAGHAAPASDVAQLKASLTAQELDEVDQTELDRSLRLKLGLDGLRKSGRYDAFAIRCWPETFTEYGGAVCGPVSMMGEARVPCACEADVYGALTQMILQEAADQPVFLTDLVDMDVNDNTGVVWHCGQAPLSMLADGDQEFATIHTNRKMPLLYEFALKPGRVTLMRISQASGEQKMVISAGEMLDRPKSFTGTSGVVQFDRPCADVLNDIMASRLEHHMALAYGDHRELLRAIAGEMGLPVLEI